MFDLSSRVGASRSRRDRMSGAGRPQGKPRGPRLDRRNAVKNIDYDADVTSWSSSSSASAAAAASPGGGLRATRSLEHSPSSYSSQTSFRIGGGVEGEVDLLCRSLGLSGPDDFAIPAAAWEARKARCSYDLLPPSRLLHHDSPTPSAQGTASAPPAPSSAPTTSKPAEETREHRGLPDPSRVEIRVRDDETVSNLRSPVSTRGGDGGIRGARPPALAPPSLVVSALAPPPCRSALAPPPSMSLPVLDRVSSTWDLVRSLAPEGEDGGGRRSVDSEEKEEEEEVEEEEEEEEVPGGSAEREEGRLGETAKDLTGSCSFSTSNDDDSSSTTTEPMFVISPNGKFRRNIRSWMRGSLLGSGSFGTVYEGISDDGIFFAVKEVSLIDQGINAQQCILQLEQEIALLSQFEHENIVQYYGTDKEEAKLFIFLELVTQGSLSSLYQRYNLQDSQVSAYTRQILSGLNYLHDRNVVHRDIKCANILVHANGSVKLADFGLAKEITKFNMLKSCKGSVYWMAPEVVNPKRSYGPAADIWSLGCTVLEMLTRQIPYPNLEWTQALFRIGRGEKPPIPQSLSRDARDFISQCVQVNPDDRPSAAQLLQHLFVRRQLLASAGSDSSSHSTDRWS